MTTRKLTHAALASVLVAAAAAMAAAPALADDVVAGREVRTLVHGISLRAAPSMVARSTGWIDDSATAEVLEHRHGWVRVRADGREGWVREDQLLPVTHAGELLLASPRTIIVTERTAAPITWVDGMLVTPAPAVEVVRASDGVMLSHVDLRSVPDGVAVNVGNVDAGERVTVLAHQGGHAFVRARNGEDGWVPASAVTTILTPAAVAEPAASVAWLAHSSVLRAQPVSWSRAIAALDQGDELRVLARGDSWLQVRDARGNEGWVMVDALQPTVIAFQPGVGDVIAPSRSLWLRVRPNPMTTGTMPVRAWEPVRVLARSGDWLYVRDADGQHGWIPERDLLAAMP